MKDCEFRRETLEAEISSLKDRVKGLEQCIGGSAASEQKPLKLDIVLPAAEIGGLRFNETKVSAVFDFKEDGWYHSRDILFMSARNLEDTNSRDILTEYLESAEFRASIAKSLFEVSKFHYMFFFDLANKIEVSLPINNEGSKKYNGSVANYWLKPISSEVWFHSAYTAAYTSSDRPSLAMGVALMFRVKETEQ